MTPSAIKDAFKVLREQEASGIKTLHDAAGKMGWALLRADNLVMRRQVTRLRRVLWVVSVSLALVSTSLAIHLLT